MVCLTDIAIIFLIYFHAAVEISRLRFLVRVNPPTSPGFKPILKPHHDDPQPSQPPSFTPPFAVPSNCLHKPLM